MARNEGKHCFTVLHVLQAPVVRRLDNAIQWINHYPVDSVVCFVNTYSVDSDLSGPVCSKADSVALTQD